MVLSDLMVLFLSRICSAIFDTLILVWYDTREIIWLHAMPKSFEQTSDTLETPGDIPGSEFNNLKKAQEDIKTQEDSDSKEATNKEKSSKEKAELATWKINASTRFLDGFNMSQKAQQERDNVERVHDITEDEVYALVWISNRKAYSDEQLTDRVATFQRLHDLPQQNGTIDTATMDKLNDLSGGNWTFGRNNTATTPENDESLEKSSQIPLPDNLTYNTNNTKR